MRNGIQVPDLEKIRTTRTDSVPPYESDISPSISSWGANTKHLARVKGLHFLATMAFGCIVFGAPAHAQELSPTDQNELRKVAIEFREAILKENVEGILKHLRQGQGLTCTDTLIPYRQVKNDLYNKNSHLYMSLFNSAKWNKQCGSHYPAEYTAISEKEFFSKTIDEPIEITALEDGWAKVTFKSKNKSLYPREWYFHKEGGVWKFGDGFILSLCSCG
jgi:hypothetical protein